jgi:hypothetical protein
MDAVSQNHESEDRKQFYTPKELIIKFPEVELFNWNANKIGAFHNGHLLSGLTCGSERQAKIWIQSFERLVDFANTVEGQRKVILQEGFQRSEHNKMFYTPDELIKDFPAVGLFGWNANKLGVYFSGRLMTGLYSGAEKRALIWFKSFERLVEFANTVEDKRKVHLRGRNGI